MDDALFQDHIDRFGDDVRLWPAAVQATAERYRAASPVARALLAEARALRLALGATVPVRAPKALKDSIFAAAFDGDGAGSMRPLRKAKAASAGAART